MWTNCKQRNKTHAQIQYSGCFASFWVILMSASLIELHSGKSRMRRCSLLQNVHDPLSVYSPKRVVRGSRALSWWTTRRHEGDGHATMTQHIYLEDRVVCERWEGPQKTWAELAQLFWRHTNTINGLHSPSSNNCCLQTVIGSLTNKNCKNKVISDWLAHRLMTTKGTVVYCLL